MTLNLPVMYPLPPMVSSQHLILFDSSTHQTKIAKFPVIITGYAPILVAIRDLFAPLHYITLHYTPVPHFTPPTAIMPKSCIICSAEASLELQLQYCTAQSASCIVPGLVRGSIGKKQHKQICKLLNVGHGRCGLTTIHFLTFEGKFERDKTPFFLRT
jgi:hypothetical protein